MRTRTITATIGALTLGLTAACGGGDGGSAGGSDERGAGVDEARAEHGRQVADEGAVFGRHHHNALIGEGGFFD